MTDGTAGLTAGVIVHIGMPKTGTTLVQRTLAGNRQRLLRAGFSYPDLSTSDPAVVAETHWDLFSAIDSPAASRMSAEALERYREDFEQDRARHRVVLSAENAWLRPADSSEGRRAYARKVLDFVGGDAVVVVYLRRQSDYALALFNTLVRNNTLAAPTLEQALIEYLPTVKHLDYAAALEDWGSVFGRDRLVVRQHDRSRLVNGDIMADLSAVVGLPPVESVVGDSANASISMVALRAKLAINNLPGIDRPGAMRAFREIREAVPADVIERRDTDALRAVPGLDDLDERCEEANRLVAQRYFGRDDLFGRRDRAAAEEDRTTDPIELVAAGLHRLAEAGHQQRLARRARRAAQA